jgi:putative DNA primase/helicase
MTSITLSNCDQTVTLETPNPLFSQHYKELIEKRSLPLPWVLANCKSVSKEEATELLGYPAKSPGILLKGDGYQVQFKPDNPWKSDNDKKAPKYRTAREYENDYDAIAPKHPTEIAYWDDLQTLKERCYKIDGHHCILVTEGLFKAISATSEGIPTIALLGVEMGLTSSKNDPQGKRYLVKTLEKFAKEGFGFIVGYDADCVAKKNVLEAERKLTHQLKQFGVPVYSITGKWSVEDGKGMDDYINKQGIEKFREILLKAEQREWDEVKDKKNKFSLPPVSVAALEIAEINRDKLAWESEYKLWRHYGAKHDGLWSEETVESVRGLVHDYLRNLPDSPPFNAGYVSSIVTTLQSDLEVKEWDEQKELIPLRDGVLDRKTLKLNPHSPSYKFTWQLPFKWEDSDVGCEPIEEFLLKITGVEAIAEVLLAYLSAIVTSRSDLQRYLELVGGGGTGKSTYMALAQELVGEDNTVSSRLSLLENNRFETAKFLGKRLGLFPDSERWQGEVSVLKQLIGQDLTHYERKGIQQCKGFRFPGMMIVSANEPPESSDRTSGQERRKLTVGLDIRVPEYEGRNLIEEFKPFLPGLLRRVLEIPRERVTALIKFTEKNVPALANKKWEQMIETNPIAAWVDDCIVIAPNAKCRMGTDSLDPNDPRWYEWIYPNFVRYHKESGHKTAMSVKKFSSNFQDLLKNQMKVPFKTGKDEKGRWFEGVGLRSYYDPNGTYYPHPVTGESDGLMTDFDKSLTDETIETDGFDGLNGCQKDSIEGIQNESLASIKDEECLEVCAESSSNTSNPSVPSVLPTPDTPEKPLQPVIEPLQAPVTIDELQGWMTYNKAKAYPNPKSDNERSSQKRSLSIRESFRSAKTVEDLSALNRDNGGEFSKEELTWVKDWVKLFFASEFRHLQATAKITQLGLDLT